ncbi:MAG: hypothetical protein HOW73_29700 [Polyangiaceae bacterium]|nr:hypothetical protein [Polyangiaceae bacterium]
MWKLERTVFFSVMGLSLLIGCSDGTTSGGGPPVGGGGSDATGAGGPGGQGGEDCQFGCGNGGEGAQQGFLMLEPQNPVIDIVDGAVMPLTFTVTQNGDDVTDQVSWFFDRPDIGLIDDGTGIFDPGGVVGGIGNLKVALGNGEAATTVTVNISKTVNTGGISAGDIAILDAPSGGADPSMQVLYPYDETVFPLGVLAPEIMWNGTQGGDIYKLSINEAHYHYVEYFTAAPPSRHLIAEVDWAAIENSGTGPQTDPTMVSLTRLSGGVAYQPVTRTWRIAQGKLKGAVYYWELPDVCGGNENGRILRIKPDSPNTDEFFQPGTCWGCHTVSRDGTQMMATLDNATPFPQITVDLTQEPATYGNIQPPGATGGTFSAFNDTGSKILVSDDGNWQTGTTALRIIDSANGAILNPNAIGNNCAEPAWSPDGKKIAAICGVTNSWVFDSYQGELVTADVGADGVSVSSPVTIVSQAAGVGRPAYPSFSPGSEYIAYGRPTQGSRSTGNGKIWLTRPDGTDNKELTTASSDDRSFNPVFAPLRAGGYFWLVFISRRDYGNRLVGANRQQLWITAISDPPSAADPSHPPFYMRGQEDCGKSENAYFALEPCKQVGESCESGVDCCNGQCVQDPNTGELVCGEPPPPGECSEDGNACVETADCCNPDSICIDGFCQQPPPT